MTTHPTTLAAPIPFDTLMKDENFADLAEMFDGYEDYSFISQAQDIARAMFAPSDVYLDYESTDEGELLNAQMTVSLRFADVVGYLSVYLDFKNLTSDHEATGVDGYRAIYTALMGKFTDLDSMVTPIVTSGIARL